MPGRVAYVKYDAVAPYHLPDCVAIAVQWWMSLVAVLRTNVALSGCSTLAIVH